MSSSGSDSEISFGPQNSDNLSPPTLFDTYITNRLGHTPETPENQLDTSTSGSTTRARQVSARHYSFPPIPFRMPNASPETLDRINLLLTKYPYDPADDDDINIPAGPHDELDDALATRYLEALKLRAKKAKEQERFESFAKALGKNLNQPGQPDREKTPKFSGKPDEVADAHLLLVRDWQVRKAYQDRDMKDHFLKTLEGDARVWYGDIMEQEFDWKQVQREFLREYSKGGKHNRQLKADMAKFQFDPAKDGIARFIRDVKSTGKLLGLDDDAICTTIKEAMPAQVYWSIHNIMDLGALTQTLMDFFTHRAPKPVPDATPSPFMMVQTEDATPPVEKKPTPFKPKVHPGRNRNPRGKKPQVEDDQPSAKESTDELLKRVLSEITSQLKGNNARMPPGRGAYRIKGDLVAQYDRDYVEGVVNKVLTRGRNATPRDLPPRGKDGKFLKKPQGTPGRRFLNPNPHARGKPTPPKYSELQQKIDSSRCRRCNEPGHWAKECPYPARMQSHYTLRPRYYSVQPAPATQTVPSTQLIPSTPHTATTQLVATPSPTPHTITVPAVGRTLTYTDQGYQVIHEAPPVATQPILQVIAEDGAVEVEHPEN